MITDAGEEGRGVEGATVEGERLVLRLSDDFQNERPSVAKSNHLASKKRHIQQTEEV